MIPVPRRLVLSIGLAAFVFASCTADDTSAPATASPTASPTAAPTPRALPGGELTRCTSPEGFEISYPQAWETNAGDVVPACSQFDPEPFEVPRSDERVAAVTAYVDPVPFHEAAAPEEERDADRAVTVIDDLQAVRLSYEAFEEGFYPAGTPITVYMIDLSIGVDRGPGTMFLDAVGIDGSDHDRNQIILDRMARTVDVTLEGSETDPVVARYEGGGGGFSVAGRVTGDEACLRIPPDGEAVCTEAPGSDEVETVELVDLQEPLLSGVAGDEVFRVTVERDDGGSSTVLPAPIEGSELRGFAFTLGPDEVDRLTWYDVVGNRLGATSR